MNREDLNEMKGNLKIAKRLKKKVDLFVKVSEVILSLPEDDLMVTASEEILGDMLEHEDLSCAVVVFENRQDVRIISLMFENGISALRAAGLNVNVEVDEETYCCSIVARPGDTAKIGSCGCGSQSVLIVTDGAEDSSKLIGKMKDLDFEIKTATLRQSGLELHVQHIGLEAIDVRRSISRNIMHASVPSASKRGNRTGSKACQGKNYSKMHRRYNRKR
ncbi:hypothetical protein ACFL08_00575 [Patescibacteria group bacterium]